MTAFTGSIPTEYLSREETLEARKRFVEMIKDENFYRERYSRWSLKQHWSGAAEGFADDELQRRWKSFLEGNYIDDSLEGQDERRNSYA